MSALNGKCGAAPTHAPGGLAVAPTRAEWGFCGAWARSKGRPCKALGSGVGGRCALHGGLSVGGAWGDPVPEFRLLLTPSGCLLSPSRCARGRWPAERARLARKWPKPIRQFQARELVLRGKVKVALVHHRASGTLLADLKAAGVRVALEGGGTALVQRMRFDASDVQPRKRRKEEANG